MAEVHRPNRDILDKWIGVYHDCMREFVAYHLDRAAAFGLVDAIRMSLRGKRLEELEEHLLRGGKVEGFLDVRDFPTILDKLWDSLFKAIVGSRDILTHCRDVTLARNKVYHRPVGDIAAVEAISHLHHVSEVFGLIGCSDYQSKIKQATQGILDAGASVNRDKPAAASRGHTTSPGFVNPNRQKNLGRSDPPEKRNGPQSVDLCLVLSSVRPSIWSERV